MPADDAGERTEQPTPRRREEAREAGRIARSTDLSAALALLGGLLLLKMLGGRMFGTLLSMTQELGSPPGLTPDAATDWGMRVTYGAVSLLVPFLGVLVIVAALGCLAQSGLLLTWKRLQPDLTKLNPVVGVRRIISLDAVVRLGTGLLKMICVAAVAYLTIVAHIGPVLSVGGVAARAVLPLGADVAFQLALRLGLVLLFLGILDYLYQRWQHEKGLRMTKQEVRDELKRMEGDPLVKHRRRQVQTRLAMQRIQLDVPKADVVVTNPTEYAVALKYDPATMSAPRLIAKGKDLVAARIRQVAQQHGIPIVQRPPLARSLFAAVEVGQEIPAAFYRAVAELLAYVYQLTGRTGYTASAAG